MTAAKPNARFAEITAEELKSRLKSRDALQLIDVREPGEFAELRIPGARLIPLGEVVERMDEIDATREAVLYCAGGVRSVYAIRALRQAGYAGPLINLTGGIIAWCHCTN